MEQKKNKGIFLFEFIVVIILVINYLEIEKYLNSEMLVDIKAGFWMLENKEVLKKDIFSYMTYNENVVNLNWLYQIINALFYKLKGFLTLICFYLMLGISAFIIILKKYIQEKKDIFFTVLIILIGIFISSKNWKISSEMFTYIFIILILKFSEKYWNDYNKKNLFVLFFILFLWSNINEEFLFGFIICITYLIFGILFYLNNKILIKLKKIEEKEKMNLNNIIVFFIFILSIILSIIIFNPFHIKAFELSFIKLILFPFINSNFVYKTIDFKTNGRLFLYFMTFFIFILSINKSKKREWSNWAELFLLLLFAFFSFRYSKYIEVFILVLLYLIPNFICFDFFNEININKREKIYKIYIDLQSLFNIQKLNILLFVLIFIIFSGLIFKKNEYLNRIPDYWKRSRGIEYIIKNRITEKVAYYENGRGDMMIWYAHPYIKSYINSFNQYYFYGKQIEKEQIFRLEKDYNYYMKKNNIKYLILEKNLLLYYKIVNDENWEIVFDDKKISIFYMKK